MENKLKECYKIDDNDEIRVVTDRYGDEFWT